MKNKDINIEIIYQLLRQVPDDVEVTGIELTDTYRVKFVMDYDDHKEEHKEASMECLMELIKQNENYDEIKKQGKNRLKP